MESCHAPHREALEHALRALAEAVTELGLQAVISGPITLCVTGETPAPEESGVPSLEAAEPLSQAVTIESRDGRLWWCWVWADSDGGGHDSEPIRPIEEIDEVARRIRTVVALPSAT